MQNITAVIEAVIERESLSDILFAAFNGGHGTECYDPKCALAVREFNGGFFITFGHPQFNSKTNNGMGYDTDRAARAAIARVAARRSVR